jgi:hypothetical protein
MANANCVNPDLVEILDVLVGPHQGTYSLAQDGKLREDGLINGYAIQLDDLTGIYYTIKIRDDITSIAADAFTNCRGMESIVIGNSVTTIGDNAFRSCIWLESVIIPGGIKSIGQYAFYDCTSLTSIKFKILDTGTNYRKIGNVSKLPTINSNDESISYGAGVFSGVYTQDAIYGIPGCIMHPFANNYDPSAEADDGSCTYTRIAGNSNANCVDPSLVEILDVLVGPHQGTYSLAVDNKLHLNGLASRHEITEGDLDISGVTYTIKIRDDVTSIAADAFNTCRSMESIVIGNSVTTIGDSAFRYCELLESVIIPDSVTSIGIYAFQNCTSLQSVTIGNSVTSIGDLAFNGCTSLTSITFRMLDPGLSNHIKIDDVSKLPTLNNNESITYGIFVFYAVPTQDVIYVRSGCIMHPFANNYDPSAEIDDGSCTYTRISGNSNANCVDPSLVEILDVLVGPHQGTYSLAVDNKLHLDGLASLHEITEDDLDISGVRYTIKIRDDVTSIDAYTFTAVGALTSVEFGTSLEIINAYAFMQCTGLESVIIPDSITSIGNNAFYQCTSLTSIKFKILDPGTNYIQLDNVSKLPTIKNNDESITYGSSVFTNVPTQDAKYLIEGCKDLIANNYDPSAEADDGSCTYTVIAGNANTNCVDPSLVEILYVSTGPHQGTYSLALDNKLHLDGSASQHEITEGDLDISGVRYTIKIRDDVTSIGNYVFQNCIGLTSVTIGDNITNIGVGAFTGCTSLTSYNYVLPDATQKTVNLENPDFTDMTIILRGFDYTFTSELIISDSVTSIGVGAFYQCTSLTAVTIPDSVTSIGSNAFEGSGLESVTIGNSVTSISNYTFKNCSSLTSVIIPDSVTSIGSNAFEGSGLESVTIGNSVTSISNNAFKNCSSLTSVIIPDSVTSIGGGAFYKCTSLTAVLIGNSVTSIGGSVFYGCTNLQSIKFNLLDPKTNYTTQNNVSKLPTINNNDESITYGDFVFTNVPTQNAKYLIEGCKDLIANNYNASAEVDDGSCEYLGCTDPIANNYDPSANVDDGLCTYTVNTNNANENCVYPGLVKVLDVSGGPHPGTYSLAVDNKLHLDGSASLHEITEGDLNISGVRYTIEFRDDVTSIAANAFYGLIGLKSVTIGNSITSIGVAAFMNCQNMTSLVLGNKLKDFGSNAFTGCTKLESVTFGAIIERIGTSMFEGCTSLTSITIPNTVKQIGWGAFKNCFNLESVIISNSVTDFDTEAFYDCRSLTSIKFNFLDPETSYTTQSNVSKLPTKNSKGENITYDDRVFAGVITQEAIYLIQGCTDPLASNYDPSANIDDGSCEYSGCTNPLATNYDPTANINDGSCTFNVSIDAPTITEATTQEEKEEIIEAINTQIDNATTLEEKENKIDEVVNSNALETVLVSVPEIDAILGNTTNDTVDVKNIKKEKVKKVLKLKEQIKAKTTTTDEELTLEFFTIKKTVKEDTTTLDSEDIKEATLKELKRAIPAEKQNVKLPINEAAKATIAETYGIQSTKLENKTVQVQIVTDETVEIQLADEVLAIEVPLNVTVPIKTQTGEIINLKTEVSTTTTEKVVNYNGVEYKVGDTILTNNGDLLIVTGIGSILLEPGKSLVQRDASYSEFLVITDLVTNEDVNVVNYNVLQDVSNVYLYDGESLIVEISGNTTSVIDTATVTTDGLLNVILKQDAFGTDTITFKLTSSLNSGDNIEKTMSVQVTAVNDAPTTEDISGIEMLDNESKNITIIASDVDNTDLSYAILDNIGGKAVISGNVVTYTPAIGDSGLVTIPFTVSDGLLNTSGNIYINVSLSNTAPTISPISDISLNEGDSIIIDLSINDTENNITNYDISYTNTSGVLDSVTLINENSQIRIALVEEVSEISTEIVTLTVGDVDFDVSVSFNVTAYPVNDVPTVVDVSVNTQEDVSVNITLSGSDVDGDNLTYTVVTGPSHGTVTISGNVAKYTPDPNYNGQDIFTYKANDGTTDSSTATVTIYVAAVNDVPTITEIADVTINEGESLEIPVTITDVEGGYTVSVSQNPVVLQTLTYTNGKITAIAREEYANDVSTNVTVTVVDGDHTVTESFIINITSVNDPHTLLLLNGKTSVNEGENILIRYIVNDNDLLASNGSYTLELYKENITEPIQIETISGIEGNKTISGNVTIGTATEGSDRTETYRIKIIDSVGISVEASRSITISQVRGCTDPNAENYNPEATVDDGSCFIVGYENGVLRLSIRNEK